MLTGTGQVTEIHLDGSARIDCAPGLIPGPGQYALAHAAGSDSPLSVPVFFYDSTPAGFHAAPRLPAAWTPGTRLNLRGPLGHGFTLSPAARKIALITLDGEAARLHPLITRGLAFNAEIVMLTDTPAQNLPEAVEVQPTQALLEICQWADFIAIDVTRENLDRLRQMLMGQEQIQATREAQILIRVPMPCGALADCGVCALSVRQDWKMACKDGPVFTLRDIFK